MLSGEGPLDPCDSNLELGGARTRQISGRSRDTAEIASVCHERSCQPHKLYHLLANANLQFSVRETSLRSRSAVITANEIYPFYISSLFIYLFISTVTDIMHKLLSLRDFILITSVKVLFLV